MAGTKAEQHLLAAVIGNPKMHSLTEGLVSRADFTDDRLGIIFEQVLLMISRSEAVDPIGVADRFPEWDVRGLSFADLMEWNGADVYSGAAGDYARAVRSAALRRVAREVAEYLSEESQDGGIDASDVLTTAKNRLDSAIDGATSGKIKVKTLREVLDGNDTYDWVIPDLLERQDRLILTGGEGAGKTTLARQLCIMSAAGLHPFRREVEIKNGREVRTPSLMQPARVLVIDAENTERQWRRMVRYISRRARELGPVDPAEEVMIATGHRINVTRGSHLSEIHRLIDQHRPDLLYIGPLYKITHGAITNEDDAAPVLEALDSLRERGVALLMEAHAAKGSGEGTRNLRPRGSGALMGWPEFGFGLDRNPGDPVAELVAWRGQRDPNRMWPKMLRQGDDWPWEMD
ncbi:hypothetical protein Leucomu_05825 [Leucobacter muris]|uniref:DNA helicase DnaB-like N-terminal domain-containing protein n=1 Tax=Leucobacter muris TaxID=1935379 RepID=A0ABX5QEK7_9MICO|nr:AAA family ATPase [Leucobacter muris]QAB17504.1 hypothetical protein Leucomu_05825 [Leucobacter muris]